MVKTVLQKRSSGRVSDRDPAFGELMKVCAPLRYGNGSQEGFWTGVVEINFQEVREYRGKNGRCGAAQRSVSIADVNIEALTN